MTVKVVSDSQHIGEKAKRGGEQLAHARQLGWLARVGLVARGGVYFVIGLLALELALGEGGKATSQQGAMKTIAAQPFGKVLLILLAIGLAGYALWRLTRAAIGHGAEQRDSAGDRVAALASGIAYLILCVTAVSILVGAGSTSGSPKEATAGVLGWSGGTVLVAIAGIVLIGVAMYQAHRGLSRNFLEDAETNEMSAGVRKAYTALGVVGLVARAVIFALIGYGLIKAAIDYQPKEAVGIEGALRKLTETSFGPLLLGAVAAGLIVFALYSIADARYRKV
ncbi:MAG TPA: DUF1206 domain-containing protein [Solirubrobacterales bacterium]|jgi:hypothetical protein|nr:DUF1206 domain-containing protein [Solirubrobacterales bacterium]